MAELPKKFTAKTFPQLKGLKGPGLSDAVLETHFKLYEGYVNRLNKLQELTHELVKAKQAAGNPVFAELSRRMGFEWNGMLLHEYYFANMRPGGSGPEAQGQLRKAMEESFGSYDNWLTDFRGIASMPGIGWVGLYQDPERGQLSNHWIGMHEENHPAGYKLLMIMDVWEHAFTPDLKANERAKYVDAFFQNIDFDVVEQRLLKK
jgi:Fe-Mn family superoxide dismutase